MGRSADFFLIWEEWVGVLYIWTPGLSVYEEVMS